MLSAGISLPWDLLVSPFGLPSCQGWIEGGACARWLNWRRQLGLPREPILENLDSAFEGNAARRMAQSKNAVLRKRIRGWAAAGGE